MKKVLFCLFAPMIPPLILIYILFNQLNNIQIPEQINSATHINESFKEFEKALEKNTEWINQWREEDYTITAYAPLDPNAIEGMCYSGNPNITASGEPTTIHTTAAGPPHLPFGTKIIIPNLNKTYIIQDRGGAVKGQHIDITVPTRIKAFQLGRSIYPILIKEPE